MTLDQPTWLYRGQFGRIFPEGSEIPDGWALAPEVPFAAEGEWLEIIELYHTPQATAEPVNAGHIEAEVAGFGGGLQRAEGGDVRRGPGRPPKIQEG